MQSTKKAEPPATGDAASHGRYPNTPIASLMGGYWSGGEYVIEATNALTITSSTFTNYGSNIDGRIIIFTNGEYAAIVNHSSAPLSNSLSYTMPANTLAGGQSYPESFGIAFDAIVNSNAALAGSYNCAYYEKATLFQVVTIPHLNVQSWITNSIKITFSGVIQQSSDLKTWNDISPQPSSPWFDPIGRGASFFRVRND
jgi:hypothetical protein